MRQHPTVSDVGRTYRVGVGHGGPHESESVSDTVDHMIGVGVGVGHGGPHDRSRQQFKSRPRVFPPLIRRPFVVLVPLAGENYSRLAAS